MQSNKDERIYWQCGRCGKWLRRLHDPSADRQQGDRHARSAYHRKARDEKRAKF